MLDADKAGSLHVLTRSFLWCQWDWQKVGNICMVSLSCRENKWDWEEKHIQGEIKKFASDVTRLHFIWTGRYTTMQICASYFTKERNVFGPYWIKTQLRHNEARIIKTVFRHRFDRFSPRHMLWMYEAGAAGWSRSVCVCVNLESICKAHHHLLFVQIIVKVSEQRMIMCSCVLWKCNLSDFVGKMFLL